ncbi:FecR family protein [Pedobacter nyackensis]|uniref:FecR family protein n=1 Tax=Pedobacter nyackensis TaxID=475255 RepID=UPI00292F1024|nr:FecR domain-containing protein [Pedobacter nyackensis]
MNKALLKKYLNHTCNDQELEEVKQFLQQPDSTSLFNEVIDEAWQEMEAPELNIHAMVTYRRQLMGKLQSEPEPIVEPTKLWPKKLMRYAAILILPILFGLYQLSKYKTASPAKVALIETVNHKGQRSKVTLSDGTLIYLGSNSKIRYPKTFSKTREIELIGEAFFKVKRDTERPFIVHTNNIQTKVLGTSFKIEAFEGTPIEVSVATGKVSVDRLANATDIRLSPVAVLTPGHHVSWDEKTKKSILTDVSPEELELWKDGVLTFNNQRLADVMTVLERHYDIKILIPSIELSNYRINTTCSLNESITKIMEIMGKAGGFKYKLEHDQITISN